MQDIRVLSSHLDQDGLRARLSVSDHVRSGSADLDGGVIYEDGALVPDDQWRALSDDELDELTNPQKDEQRYFANLALMPMPLGSVDVLAELSEEQERRVQERSLRTSPSDIRVRLHDLLSTFHGLRPVGPMLSVGTNYSRAGLVTVTPSRDGRRVGLHVDSWDDGLSFRRRREGSNRLAANIGQQSRFLLFLPFQVSTLVNILGLTDSLQRSVHIPREYLTKTERPCIYRLEIKPYECYVAPTENMIHDASTYGMTSRDICLFVRGHIHINSFR